MTDITSPDPASEDGTAKMISGAVQYDGEDVVVKPQDGVDDPFVTRDVTAGASNARQADLQGEQPEVSGIGGSASQF